MIYTYLVAAIFYLLSVIGSGYYFFDVGKSVEKSIWQEKEIKQREAFDKELVASLDRVKSQNEKNQAKLIGVINDAEKRNQQLKSDIADLDNRRLYFSAKAAKCSRDQARENENTGETGEGPARIELPDALTGDLRQFAVNAQTDMNSYMSLRGLILSRLDCFEIVD